MGFSLIDFSILDYSEILKNDDRYDPRAYDTIFSLFKCLDELKKKRKISSYEFLTEFKDFCLTAFGPMTFTVLQDFGVKSCKDVGEIVKNLITGKIIGGWDVSPLDDFEGGYDFYAEFKRPFLV